MGPSIDSKLIELIRNPLSIDSKDTWRIVVVHVGCGNIVGRSARRVGDKS